MYPLGHALYTMRIGIVNALFFGIKRPVRATLPRNRPRRQRVIPQRWQGAPLDIEAADIAIVDSPSDQADAGCGLWQGQHAVLEMLRRRARRKWDYGEGSVMAVLVSAWVAASRISPRKLLPRTTYPSPALRMVLRILHG